MNHTVDTVIVGGGPAGIACAITLQKGGVSGLVIEKAVYPRNKTCAGLVTRKTRETLDRLLGPDFDPEGPGSVFCDRTDYIELYDRTDMLTRSGLSAEFRFVRRAYYDAFLARRYQALGGTILEGRTCASIDRKARRIVLDNGDTVDFRHLVAADGALSSTAKTLGFRPTKRCFCVETHLPKSALPDVQAVRVLFRVVPNGYAWVFPSGNAVCVGLGGLYDKSIRCDALLKDLIAALGADPDACTIRGAFIPCGRAVSQRRGGKDILLIGDAGGFADPITGEGLYYSLVTGMAAGDAICKDPENAGRAFRRSTAPCAKMIRQGCRLKNFFYLPWIQKLFVKVIRGHNSFAGFFCNNIVSDYKYEYADIFRMIFDCKRERRAARRESGAR